MNTDQKLLQTRNRMLTQRNSCTSLHLATTDSDNTPEASYAPCLHYDDSLWLFISSLSSHTRNIERTGQLGVLIINSDSETGNAFARQRQSLLTHPEREQADSERYNQVLDAFTSRFGDTVELMRQLSDFHLYRLKLVSGRYIEGFGQAYDLTGDTLDQLNHVGPDQFRAQQSESP